MFIPCSLIVLEFASLLALRLIQRRISVILRFLVARLVSFDDIVSVLIQLAKFIGKGVNYKVELLFLVLTGDGLVRLRELR